MPRAADPRVRTELLAAATELMATEGRRALTTRRLAATVGTSTMAVYTHFGSMDRLQHEIRRDGFARLCLLLDEVPRSADPVADLAALLLCYVDFGTDQPQLYRAMFADRAPADSDEGSGVFDRVLAAVDRCTADGRFDAGDLELSHAWAGQLWMTVHGTLSFTHSGLLPGVAQRFLVTDVIVRLAIGYGDDASRARDSVDAGQHARPPGG